jgi:hypothetical protein
MTEFDVARGVVAPSDGGFDLCVDRITEALKLGGWAYALGDQVLRTISFTNDGKFRDQGTLTIAEEESCEGQYRALTVVDERPASLAKWELELATSSLVHTVSQRIGGMARGSEIVMSDGIVVHDRWIGLHHLRTVLNEMAHPGKERTPAPPQWLMGRAAR